MHILGRQQPGTAAQAGQQIRLHRLGDQPVEFPALGGYRFVTGLGADAQHWRQQWHQAYRIQPAFNHLGFRAAGVVHRDR